MQNQTTLKQPSLKAGGGDHGGLSVALDHIFARQKISSVKGKHRASSSVKVENSEDSLSHKSRSLSRDSVNKPALLNSSSRKSHKLSKAKPTASAMVTLSQNTNAPRPGSPSLSSKKLSQSQFKDAAGSSDDERYVINGPNQEKVPPRVSRNHQNQKQNNSLTATEKKERKKNQQFTKQSSDKLVDLSERFVQPKRNLKTQRGSQFECDEQDARLDEL